jgi:hypothetical protein
LFTSPTFSDPPPPAKDQPKTLLALPLGVSAGATTKVILRGSKLDTATAIKCSDDKITIKILSKGKAGVPKDMDPAKIGDTQVEIEITVPAHHKDDAQIIVVTPTGDAPAHRLFVDDPPAVQDKEPNNSFAQAQALTIGQTAQGTIDGAQDVDVFRFDGKAGMKISVEILAARHGSPLDSHLTLYDAKNQVVAANDDQPGTTDSKIEATLPRDGAYFISVIDSNDQGGPLYVYRLMLRQQ